MIPFRKKRMGATAVWQGGLTSPGNTGGGYETFVWTTIPSTDPSDRDIYVSSSIGNNAWDGFFPDNSTGANHGPKLNIADGKALLRDLHGDRLWLKRGDSWNEIIGSADKSGFSSARPMIYGAYGSGARPRVLCGTNTAVFTGFGSNPNNNWFLDLEIFADGYTGIETTKMFLWLQHTDGLLIEGCYVHGGYQNLIIQGFTNPPGDGSGTHTNVMVRGNVIADAYTLAPATGALGALFTQIDTLTIEFNVWDKCGWDPAITGVYIGNFARAAYIHDECTGVTVHADQYFGTEAMSVRPGGVVTKNVVSRCAFGISVGYGDFPNVGGRSATIEDNCVLEGKDYESGTDLSGVAYRLSNLSSGTFRRNIAAHGTATVPRAIWFQPIGATPRSSENVDYSSNIFHDWGGASLFCDGSAACYSNNTLSANVFQNPNNTHLQGLGYVITTGAAYTSIDWLGSNNHMREAASAGDTIAQEHFILRAGLYANLAQWKTDSGDTTSDATLQVYADSTRTLGSYNASLGGAGTHAAYVTACRAQSRNSWDDRYTAPAALAYIKAGFV